jgi:hypothetical protein
MRACFLSWLVAISLGDAVTAAEMFLVSTGAGSLYRVDVTTGATMLVGHTGRQLHDIAFSPAGELYGLVHPDDIYHIDLSRMAADSHITTEFVGSLEWERGGLLRREVRSLEFGPDGLLYFATFDGISFSGGVFTSPTGRLGVAQIEPFFSVQMIGDIGEGNGGDLAFSPDAQLYMNSCTPTGFTLECSTDHTNRLIRVNPPLGNGSDLGSIGWRNVFGMDFVGTSLYGVTAAGELIAINTTTGAGTLVARLNPAVAVTGASSTVNFPPGDFDDNGMVTAADYERWRANFGTTVTQLGTHGDGNGNGIVDAADYVIWRNRLSSSALSVTNLPGGIPEPPTAVLVLIALFYLLPLRIQRRGFYLTRQSRTGRRGVWRGF